MNIRESTSFYYCRNVLTLVLWRCYGPGTREQEDKTSHIQKAKNIQHRVERTGNRPKCFWTYTYSDAIWLHTHLNQPTFYWRNKLQTERKRERERDSLRFWFNTFLLFFWPGICVCRECEHTQKMERFFEKKIRIKMNKYQKKLVSCVNISISMVSWARKRKFEKKHVFRWKMPRNNRQTESF